MPHQFSQPCFLLFSSKYAFDPTPRQLNELGITQAKMLFDQFVLMRETTAEDPHIICLFDSHSSVSLIAQRLEIRDLRIE